MFAIGIPFTVVADRRGSSAGNLLSPIVFLSGAWAIGRLIQGRRRRVMRQKDFVHTFDS